MQEKNIKVKDDRWAKQFGDFAENLVMYMLGQLKNMSVALVDHVGADVIATQRSNNSKKYAISVKGRNFPDNESKSYTFSTVNISKLNETALNIFGMMPAVSFVFVDNMEGSKKIRIFVMTLDNMIKMCNDENIEFMNYSQEGITFKYTESNSKHHLTDIKKCKLIDYSELHFDILSSNLEL